MRRRQQRRRPSARTTSRGGPPRRRLRWSRWLIAVLVLLPLSFGSGYAIAALVLFPPADDQANDLIVAPHLIGKGLAEVERELRALNLSIEETTELPHPFQDPGIVIAQSPVAGQNLRPGAGVRLAISTGRPQLAVPDLIGLPYQNAATLAEGLGFNITRREEPGRGAAGTVARIEPAPGTTRQLPSTILLIVNARVEPDTVGGED